MLYFITSNQQKINRIVPTLKGLGVEVEIKDLDLQEIQSEKIEDIAIHKAKDAFAKVSEPLFVVDDGWFITALNGFPGAYMKSVNHWFTPQDFLNLMQGKENREVIFQQVACYIDHQTVKTFTHSITEYVLREEKGNLSPWNNVLSTSENGLSVAETTEQNKKVVDDTKLWKEFAEWLKANQKV